MSVSDIILVITATLTGLMAGLFYAWSCSVMIGFARLTDREFVAAMQATNRAILNPVFFAAFLGAPVFLIISTVLFYGTPHFMLILAATVIYLIGNFGITMVGNVPMNNTLDQFDLTTATDEQTARQRRNFAPRWTTLNHIRAVASTVALILLIIVCLK